MPLITIIISVRNGAETLSKCIGSVIDQTYEYKELLIMDGASTDGTQEIIQSFGQHVTYWESAIDRGIRHSWNKAIEHIRGDWIIFLGADDFLWSPDTLAQAASLLRKTDPSIRVVYGMVNLVDKDYQIVRKCGNPWNWWRRLLFQRTIPMVPHQATFHRKELFTTHGKFDESFLVAGDYEYLLREYKNRPFLFIPLIVSGMGNWGRGNIFPFKIIGTIEHFFARRNNGFPGISVLWLLQFVKDFTHLFIEEIFPISKGRALLKPLRYIRNKILKLIW